MFTIDVPYRGLAFSSRFPWKIGIVSFMAYPGMMTGKGDIAGDIRTIVEDPFFDGIEICKMAEEQWSAVKPFIGSKIVARGMQPDILTGNLSLNSIKSDERRKAIELVKKELDATARRGIGRLALCSGPDPEAANRSEAKDLLVESLEEICRYAAGNGVRVLLETFDREWDKKLLIGPIADALDVVRRVREKCPNISVMWDLSHAPLLKEMPEVLDSVKDFLGHIHIGCAKKVGDRYLDTHPVFFREGAINGVEEVASLLKNLLKIGYDGMVSFEVRPEEGQTSESVITTSKGVLVSAYSKVVCDVLNLR